MNTQTLDNETCLKIIEEYISGKTIDGRHLAKEVAAILHVSEVTLSRWRNRKKTISEKTRLAIPFLCRTSNTALAINNSSTNNNGNVITNNSGSATVINSNAEKMLLELLSLIMKSDMCQDCKCKASAIIAELKDSANA